MAEITAQATELLRHRGPDDEGYLLVSPTGKAHSFGGPDTAPTLGLESIESAHRQPSRLSIGFRRLSIQDPSPAGHQPMRSACGRFWIAFNGELYNHFELRPELEASGARFRGRSDTETLLAAWSAWGAKCLDRLEGMWAFALWDREEERLHLVRDRFGIKPLYWIELRGGIAFASEISPLLRIGRISARAAADPLFRYLRLGLTDDGPETLFEGVRRIEPAEHRTFETGVSAGSAERYWSLPDPADAVPQQASPGELRSLFLKSVDEHLLSDVPVGIALSGGIDSSAIAAGSRVALGDDARLRSFSYITDDPILGEDRWIDLSAASAGIETNKVEPRPEDLVRDLDRLIRIQEEPFGSTSIYAQYRVFALARRHEVPVILSGQGADELLGGYSAHLGPRLATLLGRGRLFDAWRFSRAATSLPQVDARSLLLRAGAALVPAALEPMARRLSGESLTPPWLDRGWFAEHGATLQAPAPSPGPLHLRSRLRQALQQTSLPMLLRFEDRNAMAHSVESRVPFLNRGFVELATALPETAWISDEAVSKAVFRDAMRGLVPDAILDRRDKIGFATPEARWLDQLAPQVESWLEDAADLGIQGLRPAALKDEWSQIRAGRRPFDSRIWRGLNTIAWARVFQVSFD